MSKFKGTKGEWIIDEQVFWLKDEDNNSIEVEQITGDNDTEICFISYDQSTLEEGNSNAKLIAAAPELLEVILQSTAQMMDLYAQVFGPSGEALKIQIEINEAIIKKALGV